jgi:hypothetical protein
LDSLLPRKSNRSCAEQSNLLLSVSNAWLDLSYGKADVSRQSFSRLLLDSVKCFQCMAPIDVLIAGSIYANIKISAPEMVTDSSLLLTFEETLRRTVGAYLVTLSLDDLVKLYREVLTHSISFPSMRSSCENVQKAIVGRARSADSIEENLKISELIDALGDDADEFVMQKLGTYILGRVRTNRYHRPWSDTASMIADDLMALQQVYDKKMIKPHAEFIEAVSHFILR